MGKNNASQENVIINVILSQTRQDYEGEVSLISYSDDLAIIGPREPVIQVRAKIQAILAIHGMKLNPEKSRIARPAQGKTISLRDGHTDAEKLGFFFVDKERICHATNLPSSVIG